MRLIRHVPQFNMFRLPTVLRGHLITSRSRVTLTIRIRICLIILTTQRHFSNTLNMNSLRLRNLFSRNMSQILNSITNRTKSRITSRVISIRSRPFTISPPRTFSPHSRTTYFNLSIFRRHTFRQRLLRLSRFNTSIVTRSQVNFLGASSTTRLGFSQINQRRRNTLTISFLHRTTFLRLLSDLTRNTTANLMTIRRLNFKEWPHTAFRAFNNSTNGRVNMSLIMFARKVTLYHTTLGILGLGNEMKIYPYRLEFL